MSDSIKDISKYKVADLKRELKIRGLSTAGNKQELQERLQVALQDGTDSALLLDDTGTVDNEDILNEDDVLADEDDSSTNPTPDEGHSSLKRQLDNDLHEVTSSPAHKANAPLGQDSGPPAKKITLNRNVLSQQVVPTPIGKSEETEKAAEEDGEKKVVKLSAISMKERLALRAAKFGASGASVSSDVKKQARAARFGASASSVTSAGNVPAVNVDLLKKRAERFGIQPGQKVEQVEMEERKKKRLERFGGAPASTNGSSKVTVSKPDSAPKEPKPGRIPITAPTVSASSKANVEEKKKLRAERFKTNPVVTAK